MRLEEGKLEDANQQEFFSSLPYGSCKPSVKIYGLTVAAVNKRTYRLHPSKDVAEDLVSFLVQGSASEPYRVLFRRSGANLSVYCTCPAGENGMYCKHRIRILQGLVEGIVSENVADVQKVVGWLGGTDIEEALRRVCTLEKEADRIKSALSAAKHALSRCFLD